MKYKIDDLKTTDEAKAVLREETPEFVARALVKKWRKYRASFGRAS